MNDDRKAAPGSSWRIRTIRSRNRAGVPIAPHLAQEPPRGMLQGEVEVRNTGRDHRFDETIGQRGRVDVEKAHALDALRRCSDELDDAGRRGVASVTPAERSRP